MNEQDQKLLELHGWTVECESPFEIRNVDGSFASLQAADIVLADIRSESVVMKFPDLALGARFKYLSGASPDSKVWIKISDEGCGIVAEYNDNYICHPNWVGQSICIFADTREQLQELDVLFVE
jgi:hypothetical protein